MIVDNLEFHVTRSGSASSQSMTGLSKSLKKVQRTANPTSKALNNVVSSLKRIAMYRALRTIIKEISQAFSEGLKHAYAFSSTINSCISQTMDKLASMGLTMKNQLGASLGELLTTIQPILETIIGWITKLADLISQVFAILGGRSTYHKALDSSAKWADNTAKGAKAAKEWKNQLLGFDEINRLEAPAEGGGGSSNTPENIGNWELADVGKFEKLQQLIDITKEWAATLNLEPLITAWGRLRNAVADFLDVIWNGFIWVYQNILLPFAKWTIEETAPRIVNLLAAAFELLSVALQKLSPYLKLIWEQGLKPICQWIGQKFLKVLDTAISVLEGLTKKLKDANSFGEFLKSLDGKETIVLAIATAIGAVITALLCFKVVNGLISAFGSALSLLSSPAGVANIKIAALVVVIAALVAAAIWLYQNWDEIKEKIIEIWETLKAKFELFKIWIQGKVDVLIYIWDCLKKAWVTAGESIREDWEKLKGKWEEVKQAISDKADELSEKWQAVKNRIGNYIFEIKQFFEGLKLKWENVKAAIATKVDEFSQKWTDFRDVIRGVIDSVVGFFSGLWSSISTPINNVVNGLQTIFNWARDAVLQMNEVFKGWNDMANQRAAEIEADGSIWLQGFASGGFVDSGELFVARENGLAEMVGSIGGHTAVANNDQIVDAVSQGVYEAVSSAMGEGKSSQPVSVRVFLDSKEIRNGQQRLNRAMGV